MLKLNFIRPPPERVLTEGLDLMAGRPEVRLAVSLPGSDSEAGSQSDLDVRVPKSGAVRMQNLFGKTELSDLESQVDVTAQTRPCSAGPGPCELCPERTIHAVAGTALQTKRGIAIRELRCRARALG